MTSGLINLHDLVLSWNQLTAPPATAGLTNLRRLGLSGNRITTPPATTGLTNLQKLELSGNRLTTPPDTSGLINLQVLDVSSNVITTSPTFTGLTKLEQLDLSSNLYTTTPDLTGLNQLKIFTLRGARLEKPPTFAGLTNLISVHMENNDFTAVPDFSGLPNLKSVKLVSNHIFDLSPLQVPSDAYVDVSSQGVSLPPVQVNAPYPFTVKDKTGAAVQLASPGPEIRYENNTITHTTAGSHGLSWNYSQINRHFSGSVYQVAIAPDTPITQKWESLGGASGVLGPATRPEYCGLKDSGCFREFKNGSLYDSASTNPQMVRGLIGEKWGSMGREKSFLGYPITDESCGLKDRGCLSQFQSGAIYWSPATGAHETHGAIRAEYDSHTSENSQLGYPTSDEFCGLRDNGCAQRFQGGLIYWTPRTGAHTVWGAINDRYATLGWENSQLGYPTSDEFCGLRDNGCAQRFQGGLIYWTPASGAHPVWGAIGNAYADVGWETSTLGYPTGAEFCGLKDGGCAQRFQNGMIYWSPVGGAHPVWGAIGNHWYASKWETGRYGYPTTNEECWGAGTTRECRQRFQNGTITWGASYGIRG